jgi:hypothetical protein
MRKRAVSESKELARMGTKERRRLRLSLSVLIVAFVAFALYYYMPKDDCYDSYRNED